MIPSVTDSPSEGRVTSAKVQPSPGQGEERLAEGLGQRRVRLNQRSGLFGRRFPVDGVVARAQLFRDPGDGHVHAQDLTAGSVSALLSDDLDYAVGVADDLRARVTTEGILLHDNVVTLLLGRGFGQTHEGDLRVRVDGPGHAL